jgi:hypothetical protein
LDTKTREIVQRYDLQVYGSVAYNGVTQTPDGAIYVAMAKALLKVTPGQGGGFEVTKLADAPGPVAAGTAVAGDRLYFIVNTHLWSLGLAE